MTPSLIRGVPGTRSSELHRVSGQVLLYHEGDLEDDSVIELAEVKTCELLDLFKSVNEGISVYEELSRSLGNVEVVLEELLDSEESFVVEGLDAAYLEHLVEEGLAEGRGEVVDKTGDTEIVVAYDHLVGVEYLADLESHLSLLEGTGEVLYADNGSTDTNVYAGVELAAEGISDGTCELFEVLGVESALELLDENDIGLSDIEDEVLVLVREEVLDNVISGDIVCGDDPDEENCTAYLSVEVELTRLDDDIAGENVVEDNVLDEVVAVVLLIVILLDVGESDSENACVLCSGIVNALDEGSVVGLYAGAEGFIGEAVADKDIVGIREIERNELISRAYAGEVAAGDNCSCFVNYTDSSVDRITHLMN